MEFFNFPFIDKVIGQVLRDKRRRMGLTLTDVANALGLSYQQVQKYECSLNRISATVLFNLLKLYGVEAGKFFEEVSQKLEEGASVIASNKGVSIDSGKFNVMLVEYNPGDEAITKRALEENTKINLIVVHDGTQVIDVLKYKTLFPEYPRPNLILMDLFIPRKDGFSVMKELKRDESLQDIPIVILTNKISQDLLKKAYKLGASGYICKSFDFEIFKKNIDGCINYWMEVVNLPKKD